MKKLSKAQIRVIGEYVEGVYSRSKVDCCCYQTFHCNDFEDMSHSTRDALKQHHRIDHQGYLTFATILEALAAYRGE